MSDWTKQFDWSYRCGPLYTHISKRVWITGDYAKEKEGGRRRRFYDVKTYSESGSVERIHSGCRLTHAKTAAERWVRGLKKFPLIP